MATHATLSPIRWALLSLAAGAATLLLKFAAWRATGSVGLLSDAVESSANVIAAATALFALWYAARPADREHPYGHEKIEFFSSGIEGALVVAAALTIAATSIERLRAGSTVANIEVGAILSLAATAINFAVARGLLKAARHLKSIVLEADGQHLMADVWTSIGVLIGLGLVKITGHAWLDPALAMLIALNIARIGFDLCRRSFDGLMDRALDDAEVARIRVAIAGCLSLGETYHALRTRRVGSRRHVDYHLLVPGRMSVHEAHDLEMAIGRAIAEAVGEVEIVAHIEPVEEPAAWNDARVE